MSDDNPTPERRAWQTDHEWNRLRERIGAAELHGAPNRATAFGRAKMIGIAAGIVAVAGIAASAWRVTHLPTRVVTTAAGERIVIRLADNSVVTLGPSSTVRYSISGRRREVELDGLANFKVVHDTARPFVVRARNAVTTDLGTEFVVRAYPTDTGVQVAVTSGSVALGGARSSTPIELHSGDVGRVAANGTTAREPGGIAGKSAAWVDGRLVFDDETLSSVAAEMSRWFDVDLRVKDIALAERRVSAVYNKPSLSGVLDALTATLGAQYERSGRTIWLSPLSPRSR